MRSIGYAFFLSAIALVALATSEPVVTGFKNEEDLLQLLQLSKSESPEIFLDMDVETTADFLNLTRGGGEATLASFLDGGPTVSMDDFTAETLESCEPEYTVYGALKRGAGKLEGYDFGLTLTALESTGLSSLLEAKPEDDFKAYVLVAPTDAAWSKLKEKLAENTSAQQDLPLQSLVTYQVYGETNATLFNAVKDVINGTFFEDAPFSFFVNVPIDMLDGNATVLSAGSASGVPPELNASPILAMEPACNGLILVVDDVLLPGATVQEFMKKPDDVLEDGAAVAAAADSGSAHDGCTDTVPPSPLGTEWTCQDQKYWGKCQQYWMWAGNYCQQTCGYCGHSEFPYAMASASAEGEASAESIEAVEEYYLDPCACSTDGLSGDVYTGVAGCATMTVQQLMGMAYASSVSDSNAAVNIGREFGSRFDNIIPGTPEFNYCYVVNPKKCKKYTEPSPFFEGVRWRFC